MSPFEFVDSEMLWRLYGRMCSGGDDVLGQCSSLPGKLGLDPKACLGPMGGPRLEAR
jgi:hypothetical protein